MSRRFQFSLRDILSAITMIAFGMVFASLAISDAADFGFDFTCVAVSFFGIAIGVTVKRTALGVALVFAAATLTLVVPEAYVHFSPFPRLEE